MWFPLLPKGFLLPSPGNGGWSSKTQFRCHLFYKDCPSSPGTVVHTFSLLSVPLLFTTLLKWTSHDNELLYLALFLPLSSEVWNYYSELYILLSPRFIESVCFIKCCVFVFFWVMLRVIPLEFSFLWLFTVTTEKKGVGRERREKAAEEEKKRQDFPWNKQLIREQVAGLRVWEGLF